MEKLIHMFIALTLFLAASHICVTGCKEICECSKQWKLVFNDPVVYETVYSSSEECGDLNNIWMINESTDGVEWRTWDGILQ